MSHPITISTIMPDLLPMRSRSKGIHISNIIQAICLDKGIFKANNDLSVVWAQLGCALEWAIIQRYKRHYDNRFVEIGEIELDGIYATPDLLDLGGSKLFDSVGVKDPESVNEIKLLWMSPKHEPDSEEFFRFWLQIKSYCYMLSIPVGRLHVAYCRIPPTYRVFEQRFTKTELLMNWHYLMGEADRLGVTGE